MNILVTGGAGYIGSHAVLRLIRDGHAVTVLDNLDRGHAAAIDAVRNETGATDDALLLIRGDTADRPLTESILADRSIDTVMHFAALTYVGESVEQPLRYWRNNTASALALLESCDVCGVKRFIFSSTAATYGEPEQMPITEDTPQRPINPYGASKLAFERILANYAAAMRAQQRSFACAALRYFNVAGCDRSGVLGEDHDPETHLIPVILQAALGQRDAITIFGTDYATPDGTCIRDYVHVEDLVDAHIATMSALDPGAGDMRAYNLGIGRGYSVREIIEAAKRVTGIDFEVREGARRAGDPPALYTDPTRIGAELGWEARITGIDDIIATAWAWFREHPDGYSTDTRR